MFDFDVSMLLVRIPPILLALTLHECAHAWTAMKLGDNTAYMLGRVTLNPLKHLDLMGTLAFFLTRMIGWAKPVPVNPMNLGNPSRDMMLVSLAGPASNVALAVASAILFKLAVLSGLAVYILTENTMLLPLLVMLRVSIVMNIVLAFFNLLPIPPLDGSKVLTHFLPPNQALKYSAIEPYGFMILMVLIFTGVVGKVLVPVVRVAESLLLW